MRLKRHRAIACVLRAQGFLSERPASPTTRHLTSMLKRLRIVQIDSVTAIARAHYLPFFSRLGPYDVAHLDALTNSTPLRAVEHWAHEASFVHVDDYPTLQWRMRHATWKALRQAAADHPSLLTAIVDTINESGPMRASDVQERLGLENDATRDHWGWNWSTAKTLTEYAFRVGDIACVGRTPSFERLFASHQVAFGKDVAWPDTDEEASRACLLAALRAVGVGSSARIADYYRMRPAPTREALKHLAAEGLAREVTIEGIDEPWWMATDTVVPRDATTRADGSDVSALLCPFDPLIWHRPTALDLWGMDYKLEFYVPAAKRRFGYYVMPFLLRGELVARVDVTLDRAGGTLVAKSVHLEPHAPADTADALAAELGTMAAWLGASGIEIAAP